MATFKGQINLISMADVAESVKTIKEVQTYYAISQDGVVPPVEATWDKTIPTVPKGYYLWTKTVYIYTDNSEDIYYANSYHGEDGQKGEDAGSYFLRINKTEILKFIEKETGKISISSDYLYIGFAKQDSSKQLGYERIQIEPERLTLQIISLDDGSQVNISNTFVSNDDYDFTVDLKNLLQYANTDEGAISGADIFANENCVLGITYNYEEDNKTYNISEYVSIRFGVSVDMAQLGVNAADIVASINDAELKFSGDGLQIKNGNFVIVDSDGEQLLWSEGGNLKLKGVVEAEDGYFKGDITGASGTFSGSLAAEGGYFKGRVEAESGSFTGTIYAEAGGTIGGFNINADSLTSMGGNIVLKGTEGSIYADNITLGTNAKIEKYLQIGPNIRLNSISDSVDKFLIVTRPNTERELLSINSTGVIRIGDGNNPLVIDGLNGEIRAGNYASTSGWAISNEGAIFNNITARGSIKASVLEYGEVQTVGGMILIRPSSRILAIEKVQISGLEKTKIYLERPEGFKVGDICLVNKEGDYIYEPQTITSETFYKTPLFYLNNGEYVLASSYVDGTEYFSRSFAVLKKCFTLEQLNYDEKYIIIDMVLSEEYIGCPLVSLGNATDNKLPVGIGINASENASLLTPESLSVFEFQGLDSNGSPKLESKIILGKLPNMTDYGYAAGSYGLYAENVVLKGSLVTSTQGIDGNILAYSGINTIYSQGQSPTSHLKLSEYVENCGEILLWAGAGGTSVEDVEKSKFFVDRNGNLYAGSGYFEGTIITKSKITASEIETAILRGTEDNPALIIEDAAKGIRFTTKKDGQRVKVFEVTNSKIEASVSEIDLNGFKVRKEGSLVVPTIYITGDGSGVSLTEEEKEKALVLKKNRIIFSADFKENETNSLVTNSYIDFDNDTQTFAPNGSTSVLSLNKESVDIKTTLVINESIKYGEKMSYKPIKDLSDNLIGYDLYIE